MATYSRKKEARANKHHGFTTQIPQISEPDMLETIEQAVEAGEEPLILMLDRVQDPHNLGAILRSADAAGVLAGEAPIRDTITGAFVDGYSLFEVTRQFKADIESWTKFD